MRLEMASSWLRFDVDVEPRKSDSPAPRSPRWYGEQDENGVDLSIIRENFKRTVEERLRRAEAGRNNTLWLKRHVRIDAAKSA